MIKIAVCDDDVLDMERLERAFDELQMQDISYEVYFSAQELLEYQKRHDEMYNLYILDIDMPDMDGLELAKKIRKIDTKALFVFLTSHTEYAMDVFKLITFDYISKPIDREKLWAVLIKAIDYLNLAKRNFFFQYRRNQFLVYCEDIIFFEKKGRQAIIHTSSENYRVNMNTDEIWKQLDEKNFAHIHVSFIVNLQHVKAVEKDEVILDNGEHLIIARTQKQAFKEKHMLFLKRMV